MYIKIHRAKHDDVVAVCDENLIGKTIEDGKCTITIFEHFYKGDKKDDAVISEILKNATNSNLMGKKAVALGLKVGIITKEHVIVIAGVPHAQAIA